VDYLKDYIEVKDRIQMFYAKFPEGTLHFQYKGVLEFNGETFIYGEAFAYPERDKMAYASGWAWERVPARGFAKGAEMMTLKQVLGVVLLQLLVSLLQKVLLAERKYNVT
jgi:hypothetical protein